MIENIFEKLEKKGVVEKVKKKRVAKVKEPKPPKPIFKTYEDFDYKDLLTYAGLDCIVTSSLMKTLFPALLEKTKYEIPGKVEEGPDDAKRITPKISKDIIEAPTVLTSIVKYEMKAHEYILDLEINGMKYYTDLNADLDKRMTEEIATLEEKILPVTGRINFNSGNDLRKLLYGKLGFTPPSVTKTNEASVDGDALLSLAGIDPMSFKYEAQDPKLQWLADLAKMKDISSVHNTFVKTYVKDFVKRDGRIHPSYNLHGTSSFRITGSDPNLTQLPRPKHGYNVRECFGVEEGNVFIAADWSSAEVKVLGAISKDPTLLDAIGKGYDFHSFSGSQLLGIPYDEFIAILNDKTHPLNKQYKNSRQSAKALTFGILYGSSVNGIAMNLGVTKAEAERLIDLYFKTYPGVLKYVQDTHRMAEWNHFVFTPFGQRKQEYGTHSAFKYTAAFNAALRNSQNCRVQSTTSTAGLITFAAANDGIKTLSGKGICTVNNCGVKQ